MKTSQQPILPNGADESTCSLADFRASLSVTPGSEEARKMTATSGHICSAVLTKSSPLGSLLKMLLESSRWSSKARFLRWENKPLYSTRVTWFSDTDSRRPLPLNASAQTSKVTDIPSNRYLFRLVPWEPPTEETGSSSSDTVLLQTPTVVMTDEPPESMRARAEKNGYKNGTKFGSLASQVKYDERVREMLLPTPLAVEREHPERVKALKAAGADRINSRANGEQRPNGIIDFLQFYDLLPTPNTSDSKGMNTVDDHDLKKGYLRGVAVDLFERGLLLPTPITCDYMDGTAELRKDTGKQRVDSLKHLMAALTHPNPSEEATAIGRYLGMLPTPQMQDYNTGISQDAKADKLERYKDKGVIPSGTYMLRQMAIEGKLPKPNGMDVPETDGGNTSRLSPLFTEEMMGFPFLWTTLPFLRESGEPKHSKPTATPSCRK